MDTNIIKLVEIEAKLKDVLAIIAEKKEKPNHILGLINPTEEQYAYAWETLSTLDIIESHVELLLNNVKRGDFKKVGQFIDFTLYQLDRFGEKDPQQTVVYRAQRAVIDIYTKIRKEYFIA
ncbi:MAG: hypothetical protein K2M40_06595 [Muribaculaceae bacterium]|nr:hypothetical protein [Muribaculaceae bacterium]